MLDSLDSMYISYPFIYTGEPPQWMTHVKDVRCVAVFDAKDSIPQYKNSEKVRATLQITSQTTATATIYCAQLGGSKTVQLKVICVDELFATGSMVTLPVSCSYMLVDSAFSYDATAMAGSYILHPDTILVLQEAPHVGIRSSNVSPVTVCFRSGNNVGASEMNGGVLLFGGVAAGKGVFTYVPAAIGEVPEHMLGKGARNINGLTGSVWIRGSYPVQVDRYPPTTEDVITLTIKTDELV